MAVWNKGEKKRITSSFILTSKSKRNNNQLSPDTKKTRNLKASFGDIIIIIIHFTLTTLQQILFTGFWLPKTWRKNKTNQSLKWNLLVSHSIPSCSTSINLVRNVTWQLCLVWCLLTLSSNWRQNSYNLSLKWLSRQSFFFKFTFSKHIFGFSFGSLFNCALVPNYNNKFMVG